ncbi:MAG: alpha/beta hydrolase-fold protein, partial [Bacteroidota bacterium]
MKKYLFLLIGMVSVSLVGQVKQEIFESFKLQERRNVSYYFPENYSEDKKYPLIVVLDADYLFDVVVANAKVYGAHSRMPEAIVVGIHQSEDDLRWEDCDFEQSTGLPTEKGAAFYEFLGTELIAYLETQYNIAPFKMFVGYDITANFGNYFLFKDKSIFHVSSQHRRYNHIRIEIRFILEQKVVAKVRSNIISHKHLKRSNVILRFQISNKF